MRARHPRGRYFLPKDRIGATLSASATRTNFLINNRQNGVGRRRGRGGQRPPGTTGRPDGNRQDNRQRGNAAQLLEKYKSLARDSQLAGDRVQTETYLQFAEHYFRVLGESQARFDEQRRARGETVDNDYDDDGDGDDGEMDGDDIRDDVRDDNRPQRQEQQQQPRRQYEDRPERPQQQQQTQQRDRYERNDRPQRAERPERNDRPVERPELPQRAERSVERAEAPQRAVRAPRAERPNGRIRRDREEEQDEQRIAFDVIPPAIGASIVSDEPSVEVEETPAPRRRGRPARPKGDAEIAPAA